MYWRSVSVFREKKQTRGTGLPWILAQTKVSALSRTDVAASRCVHATEHKVLLAGHDKGLERQGVEFLGRIALVVALGADLRVFVVFDVVSITVNHHKQTKKTEPEGSR